MDEKMASPEDNTINSTLSLYQKGQAVCSFSSSSCVLGLSAESHETHEIREEWET